MKEVVKLDHLHTIVGDALENLGLDIAERNIVRQVLMYAELRGSSQGLIKIREQTVLPDKDCSELTIEQKTSSIARIDGGGHTGMYVLNRAAEAAADLVAKSGIALVSTHNTRSSTGSIGFYANEIATSGYIALVLAGSPKVMAMEGGIDPVFGTNPVAIAIPTNNEPQILDMATAATTWFAVINARDNNQLLPEGIAFDANGNQTTNPAEAMKGALRTFGGAKGSGLALMFEFLTAVLGDASLHGDAPDNRSNTIIAIDPEVIDSGFKNRASEFIARLKATRPVDRVNTKSSIRLPGEQSTARAKKCIDENAIEIDSALYQYLLKLAQQPTD